MRIKATFLWILVIGLLLSGQGVLAQAPLTDTYTSADGLISFQYPSGWHVEESGALILVATSAAVLSQDLFSAGDALMVLLPHTLLNRNYPGYGEDLATYLAGYLELINTNDTYGDFEPLAVAGYPALKSTTANETADGVLVVIDHPYGHVISGIGYSKGEAARHDPTFFAILESLTLQPDPSPTATPTTPETSVPGGKIVWQVLCARDGSTSPGTELEYVGSLALDPTGTLIYVAAWEAGVTVLHVDGYAVAVIPAPRVDGVPGVISAVDVAADGTLWLADVVNQRLHHLDAAGNLLATVGQSAPQFETADRGEFDDLGPYQLHIGPDERLYVVNSGISDPDRMLIFGPDGAYQSEFELTPLEDANGYYRFGIAPDGSLYIPIEDFISTTRMAVVDPAGNLLRIIPLELPPDIDEYGPIGAVVVLADGSFWLTDSFDGVIYHHAADGALLGSFGTGQRGDLEAPFVPGEFSVAVGTGLNGLLALPDGDLIAGDMNAAFAQVVRIDFGGD